MPRITGYTPGWLTDPAPGHKLFAASKDDSRSSTYSSNSKASRPGPRRTIAKRGTEVFVASDREIRWGDLVYLKEHWKHGKRNNKMIKQEDRGSDEEDEDFEIYADGDDNPAGRSGNTKRAQGYRIIKTPAASEIRQLVISPNENFLAILTTHTVHICTLPDSSHLTAPDLGPLKPKFHTLGPTTHVTSRSAVMSALWHPLGVNGSCLVTVTEDAVVRLWEISLADRWSFDTPTLSVDLKKLADGISLDEDFTASANATSTAFSPDSFDMEVAAAAFGARGSGLWSPMTLFIAMRGGDVYALCPLLPKRWSPPPMLIPSLSVAIVANVAAIEDDESVSAAERLLAQQQLDWMSDLDQQEPKFTQGSPTERSVEIYTRPSRPGQIPKLQGPFELELDGGNGEDDLDFELSDIYFIGQKMEIDDLMEGEDGELEVDEDAHGGLSMSVICLLSTSGQVRICLDMDGVQAKWLPSRKSRPRGLTGDEATQSLLVFQTLDTLPPQEVTEDCWPTFSDDLTSRYSFFVTANTGISFISLTPWIFRLESELSTATEAGSDVRMNLLIQGQNSTRERVFVQPSSTDPLAACIAIRDPDLDYFLLSATHTEAVAVMFEAPRDDYSPAQRRATSPLSISDSSPVAEDRQPPPELLFYEPRPVYQPPGVFFDSSGLPKLINMLKSSRYGSIINQRVRLSPATLQLFSDAHMVISTESGRLNEAVSELFRRCDKLRVDLKEQIEKAADLKCRIDRIVGDEEGGNNNEEDEGHEDNSDNARLWRNIHQRKAKQEELTKRFNNLRRQLVRVSDREMGDKEKKWVQEVQSLNRKVLGEEDKDEGGAGAAGKDKKDQDEKPMTTVERVEQIREFSTKILEEARQAGESAIAAKSASVYGGRSPSASVFGLRVSHEVRRTKMIEVQELLDRETALLEGVSGRLERLTV